nr:IQ and ubiquitin-like domain-containing protein [Vulpes vulpes]
MSDREEEFGAQNAVTASEENDDAFETINVPVSSEELPESGQAEGSESEVTPSSEGHTTHVKEENDQSFLNKEPEDEEQLMEEVLFPKRVSYSRRNSVKHKFTKHDNAVQSAKQFSHAGSLAFLDKIKAIKESLKASMKDPLATVKVVLFPVGQEIIMPFKIDTIVKYLKDHFSYQLLIPSNILQIRYAGKFGSAFFSSANWSSNLTVFLRKKLQQTTNTTSTQMTKIGVYVSNMTDKLVIPGKYFSAAEYHAQRLQAVIVLQTYYRQWHAKVVVKDLKRQKMLRLKWEAEEELRKIREKEEWIKLDYYRRHNPQTKEDFEVLYNALELWRQEEFARINQSFTGAERKAALCELLEKETQIIASIGRHRYIANMANREALIQTFLDKVPQDPLMFSKKVDFCRSCRLYLPRTEFAASAGPGPPPHGRPCRRCSALGQEARQRQSFLKLKCLLRRLHSAEARYEDDPKIAFLMQFSFQGYEPLFIHKIKHKHILAKNYFSHIPVLASFILDDGEIDEIRKKYHSETTPKIIVAQRPSP